MKWQFAPFSFFFSNIDFQFFSSLQYSRLLALSLRNWFFLRSCPYLWNRCGVLKNLQPSAPLNKLWEIVWKQTIENSKLFTEIQNAAYLSLDIPEKQHEKFVGFLSLKITGLNITIWKYFFLYFFHNIKYDNN